MDITVASPASRLVHVVWSLQKPIKGYRRYFLSSKPNHQSHSKKTSVRLQSSLAIPSGMLATNHPGGLQTSLTSNYNCFLVIALYLLFAGFFLMLLLFFMFCPALHRIMVTFSDDHGTWPGLLCTIFLLAWYLLCLYLYFANKDWLNNRTPPCVRFQKRISQSQFSFHPLRTVMGITEIYGSKTWVLLNSFNLFLMNYFDCSDP